MPRSKNPKIRQGNDLLARLSMIIPIRYFTVLRNDSVREDKNALGVIIANHIKLATSKPTGSFHLKRISLVEQRVYVLRVFTVSMSEVDILQSIRFVCAMQSVVRQIVLCDDNKGVLILLYYFYLHLIFDGYFICTLSARHYDNYGEICLLTSRGIAPDQRSYQLVSIAGKSVLHAQQLMYSQICLLPQYSITMSQRARQKHYESTAYLVCKFVCTLVVGQHFRFMKRLYSAARMRRFNPIHS